MQTNSYSHTKRVVVCRRTNSRSDANLYWSLSEAI